MFWNYLTIIYICWETSTDMKTHIIALFLLIGGALNLFGENLHNFFNRYNFSFITTLSMIFTKTLKDISG